MRARLLQQTAATRWARTLLLLAAILATLHYLLDSSGNLATEKSTAPADGVSSIKINEKINPTFSRPSSKDVLNVFQVYLPLESSPLNALEGNLNRFAKGTSGKTDHSLRKCQVLLMEHSFGFSYGKPFIANYAPPKCDFNRVTINFTVTSRGRQFDRLAIMYFNDTELWRTSTAEPTMNGIRWEYTKDMSAYLYLWKSPQKLIFDLGNLIDDTYTGPFNTTLTATFSKSHKSSEPADLVIPISARRSTSDAASVYMLPSDNATNNIKFPRNANRAVFSVSACGQAEEEFWWANVLESNTHTFEHETGTLFGYSPFREVQVLIDGQLAGAQWPFPVIFTGGVVPGLWRPIVGIDAFDLREHEIDITPWLSILSDGNEHSFEIRVVGIQDDGKTSGALTKTVGNSWYVTGKIFIWLDEDSSAVTTGRQPTILLPKPVISLSHTTTRNKEGSNETLQYTISVQRTLSISSLLTTQSGTRLVTWTQNLAVTNYGYFTQSGAVQQTKHKTTGLDQSTGDTYYKSSYTYPLDANTSFLFDSKSGNFSIDADLLLGLSIGSQGKQVHPFGLLASNSVPSTSLSTAQNGRAHYFTSPRAGLSIGFGQTRQDFSFKEIGKSEDRELYYRSVEAVNSTVVRDYEVIDGDKKENNPQISDIIEVQQQESAIRSLREILGRGPGKEGKARVQKQGKWNC